MFIRNRINVVLAIALTAMLTGADWQAALAQSTWKGAGGATANPKGGTWNAAGNWDPAGVPASNNTTTLIFNSGAGNPAYTATNDVAGTFNLNHLTLANNSGQTDTIAGNPLLLSSVLFPPGPAPTIEQNGSDIFVIQNNISLAGGGLGAQPINLVGGGAGQAQLTGVISGQGSLAIKMTDGGSYLLTRSNSYTGGTTLAGAGSLFLSNNDALGTGPLEINGGVPTIGPGPTQSRTISNAVTIATTFNAGSFSSSGSLTFSGTTTVTGVRAIGIPNSDSMLILGGPVVTGATDGIKVLGADAGNMNTLKGRQQKGGVLMFTSASPSYQGTLNVAAGSAIIKGSLGAAGTPVASVSVAQGARLYGSGNITLPVGQKLMGNGFITAALASASGSLTPGILEIDGGGVQFAALSGYGWLFDGPTAGNGDGSHSLLKQRGDTVTLLAAAGQEPILEVDVLGRTSLPIVGQTYTLIDIAPEIPRVTGNFMTSSGADLSEGAKFSDDQGFQWQISYEGGENHNDVVLTSLSLGTVIPEIDGGSFATALGVLIGMITLAAERLRRREYSSSESGTRDVT